MKHIRRAVVLKVITKIATPSMLDIFTAYQVDNVTIGSVELVHNPLKSFLRENYDDF
jgi:hypothetical protein